MLCKWYKNAALPSESETLNFAIKAWWLSFGGHNDIRPELVGVVGGILAHPLLTMKWIHTVGKLLVYLFIIVTVYYT